MEWRDEGLLLSVTRHGETAVIIDALTKEHGRARGLVRGGAGRRFASTLQPGNELLLTWRARTAEQLGSFSVELIASHADKAIEEREALTVLGSMLALISVLVPEREPTPLYTPTLAVVRTLDNREARRVGYSKWELALLADLGFALDLSRCAGGGGNTDLRYVSPKSGRAVSAEAGAPYASKLLGLPAYLLRESVAPTKEDFAASLTLTGFFLKRWALNAIGREALPDARQRLEALFEA